MQYPPMNNSQKNQFIDWLTNLSKDLENTHEDPNTKKLFPNSNDGDVATTKDLVGNFLATLTNKTITIN